MNNLHRSPYAGRWYPDRRTDLESLLDRSFASSETRKEHVYAGGLAWVAPHAGPEYSGAVAAAAYRSLARTQPERVVVIGFPHRGGLRGCAWPDCAAIGTPLGEAALDSEWLGGLPFPAAAEEALCDHSVEIQIPFLQHAAPQARFAPLYVGRMTADERRAAAEALARAWTPGTVVVASSDFTHYGRNFGFEPFPPGADTAGRIEALDRDAMEAAGSLDGERFLDALDRSGATVCGRAPISLMLDALALRGGGDAWQTELDYATSAEITGDRSHSVSYAALGYFPRESFELGRDDRMALLDAAERALRRYRDTGVRRAEPASGSDALAARSGVFVTVRAGGRLRGCIGHPHGHEPLARATPELALAAALDDPRFTGSRAEANALEVEVSVLTPFRRVRHEGQVETGRHGVHLEYRGRRALLLPQVAGEYGWDRDELLGALARKARLPEGAWRDSAAELSVFEADVFSRESEAGA
jgi:AmmeMemoRadiSam system protein B/AmmeMemoRadiSam system protein A